VVQVIETDVLIASLAVVFMTQALLVTVFLNVQNTREMLENAREQKARIEYSDLLLNKHALYDNECKSIVTQSVGELPEKLLFNVSLRKPGQESNASGFVVKRFVFVGKGGEKDVRVLEVW
jgi:hypothetical protein